MNDKLNTMESTYEGERVGGKELKRVDSHQQLGYNRENVHFVRHQQQGVNFGTSNV